MNMIKSHGVAERIAAKYPPASTRPDTEPQKFVLVIVPVSDLPKLEDLNFYGRDTGPSFAYVEAPNEHVLARELARQLDAQVVTEDSVYYPDVPTLARAVKWKMEDA